VRVRDLPIAGRRTFLLWRKRRFCCRVCGRTFTERHEELPSRQRVTRRFRRRLFARASEGVVRGFLTGNESGDAAAGLMVAGQAAIVSVSRVTV
jgi:hypothetical protein